MTKDVKGAEGGQTGLGSGGGGGSNEAESGGGAPGAPGGINLEQAQAILGYRFRDPGLLEQALRHSSVSDSRLGSYERLEFLGDAVLGLVVCEQIFETYPHMLEGELTKIKSMVVSRQSCAAAATALGLPKLMSLGKGMRGTETLPVSLAAAVLESLVGAMYLDGGLSTARGFLRGVMAPVVSSAVASGHQHNFKSLLQTFAQQKLSVSPAYAVVHEEGPDHAKRFRVSVELADRRFEAGRGNTKKQAEQEAAMNALRELGAIRVEEDGRVSVVEGEGGTK